MRFWVGSEQKSKEMKMAGTRAAERGWPDLGFVEDGRWLVVGLWVWDCGGEAVQWVGLVCFRRKRRSERREEGIEK